MPHRTFVFSLLLLCGNNLLFGQLSIIVNSIPPSTPSNTDIYLAGNFNNWNAGNASYVLTNNGNGTYAITFSPSAGLLEYKFTRGSWETVEGNASGGNIPNRTYNYTGGTDTIEVVIEGWVGKGNHTATINVSIIDEDFYMPQLNRTRRIWIYLPPDYDSTSKRYPVIYMQDGQNLFDDYYSFIGEWKVDESMNELFDNGDYGAIVVGIDNGGNQRINEYSPWKNSTYGGGDGELYAAFLVQTLKPFIDSNYRTLSAREYTGIAGSSLGANISLYTAIEYPDIFSKAGLLSPAFWFSDSIYQHIVSEGIEDGMRFYFVAGDNESETILADMMAVYDTLISAGQEETDMQLVHHADGVHSEWYWAREYPYMYEWLFDDTMLGTHAPRIVKDFIFPNPGDKYIRIGTGDVDVPYTIYTSLGNVVITSVSDNDRINISGLVPGFYFLEIRVDKDLHYISRFIKR